MAAIWQTIFSHIFFIEWKSSCFDVSLNFPRVQLILRHQWFRQCFYGDKPLSETMILFYWCIYASLGLNDLKNLYVVSTWILLNYFGGTGSIAWCLCPLLLTDWIWNCKMMTVGTTQSENLVDISVSVYMTKYMKYLVELIMWTLIHLILNNYSLALLIEILIT